MPNLSANKKQHKLANNPPQQLVYLQKKHSLNLFDFELRISLFVFNFTKLSFYRKVHVVHIDTCNLDGWNFNGWEEKHLPALFKKFFLNAISLSLCRLNLSSLLFWLNVHGCVLSYKCFFMFQQQKSSCGFLIAIISPPSHCQHVLSQPHSDMLICVFQ